MITARLRVRLPAGSWIRAVSRSAPDATFRLLAGLRSDDRAVELGEVVADGPDAASRRLADHSAVDSYRELESTADRVLAKYETTDTGFYEFVDRTGLPPEFPVVVRDGWYEFDFTGARDDLDRVGAALDESDRRYELVSVTSAAETADLLTTRQRDVLETALREGYFEVPRACTLTDLAADLDVDKSTASRVLRRGAARVLTWYLTGSEQSSRHPRER